MSRSTQFIGLNQKAVDFIIFNKDLTEYKEFDNYTEGMFDEKIPLGVWKFKDCYYKEIVQCVPWSSGPMIFTYLEKTEDLNKKGKRLFLWKDKHVKNNMEFDQIKGEIYL